MNRKRDEVRADKKPSPKRPWPRVGALVSLSKTGRIFGPEAPPGQVARRIYIRQIGGGAVDEQFLQSKSHRYWPMRLTSLTLRLSDRIALLGLIAIAMRGEGMLKSGGWVQSPPPVLTHLRCLSGVGLSVVVVEARPECPGAIPT